MKYIIANDGFDTIQFLFNFEKHIIPIVAKYESNNPISNILYGFSIKINKIDIIGFVFTCIFFIEIYTKDRC